MSLVGASWAPGRIAGKFATEPSSCQAHDSWRWVRAQSKKQRNSPAERHERAYGSYAELVADPDVDAIYVATLHPTHCEHTLLALGHGKRCSAKPFAVTG